MSLDWNAATVVTLAEFSACWQAMRLGETPWQLDPDAVDAHQQAAALDALRARGLTGPYGPRQDLADVLRLLADHDQHLDLRLRTHDATAADEPGQGMLAAVLARRTDPRAGCQRGALAVRHADRIALLDLARADAAHPTETLAGLLGDLRPGPGGPITLPPAAVDAVLRTFERTSTHDPGERMRTELCRRGVPIWQADAVDAMTRGATRAGQFGAATRGVDGRLRRAERVVAVHRTPGGDYHLYRTAQDVVIAPLDLGTLLDRLDHLLPPVPSHATAW